MNAARLLAALAGALALALGLATVAVPGTADAAPVESLVSLVGNDYLLLVPFGAVGILVVLAVLAVRSVSGVDQATPPDPEGVPTGPRPGAEFDRLLDGVSRLFPPRRERARERLRELAVRTVMRTEGCSREVARERVAAGTWTEDPAAAAFLAEGSGDRWRLVRALFDGRWPFRGGMRRAALEIERRGGVGER